MACLAILVAEKDTKYLCIALCCLLPLLPPMHTSLSYVYHEMLLMTIAFLVVSMFASGDISTAICLGIDNKTNQDDLRKLHDILTTTHHSYLVTTVSAMLWTSVACLQCHKTCAPIAQVND